jgi:hypothetical protein
MSTHRPFLAQPLPLEIVPRWDGLSSTTRELLAVAAAGVLVGLAGLLWAAFIRKHRRHSQHHSHHHHHAPPPEASAVAGSTATSDGLPRKRRKWRRRRRDHRPRNPTLAETGGLPPARPDPPTELFP